LQGDRLISAELDAGGSVAQGVREATRIGGDSIAESGAARRANVAACLEPMTAAGPGPVTILVGQIDVSS
jgi:hypothetical protein